MSQIQSSGLIPFLQICELPEDSPANILEWVHAAVELVKRWNEYDCAATAAVAVAAAMDSDKWRYGTGFESLDTKGSGWIKYDDLVMLLSQFRGLIVGSEQAVQLSRQAVFEAISDCWIREREFQWTMLLQVQPLGLIRVRELTTSTTSQTASATAEQSDPWESEPNDHLIVATKIDPEPAADKPIQNRPCITIPQVTSAADGFYSPAEVAKAIGKPEKADAIRKKLERLLKDNRLPDHAWMENNNPAKGQAKILYKLSAVKPFLT